MKSPHYFYQHIRDKFEPHRNSNKTNIGGICNTRTGFSTCVILYSYAIYRFNTRIIDLLFVLANHLFENIPHVSKTHVRNTYPLSQDGKYAYCILAFLKTSAVHDLESAGYSNGLYALIVAIVIELRTRCMKSELAVLETTFWIAANSYWMISEFFGF